MLRNCTPSCAHEHRFPRCRIATTMAAFRHARKQAGRTCAALNNVVAAQRQVNVWVLTLLTLSLSYRAPDALNTLPFVSGCSSCLRWPARNSLRQLSVGSLQLHLTQMKQVRPTISSVWLLPSRFVSYVVRLMFYAVSTYRCGAVWCTHAAAQRSKRNIVLQEVWMVRCRASRKARPFVANSGLVVSPLSEQSSWFDGCRLYGGCQRQMVES